MNQVSGRRCLFWGLVAFKNLFKGRINKLGLFSKCIKNKKPPNWADSSTNIILENTNRQVCLSDHLNGPVIQFEQWVTMEEWKWLVSCCGTSRLHQNMNPRGPNGLLLTSGRTTPSLFIMQKRYLAYWRSWTVLFIKIPISTGCSSNHHYQHICSDVQSGGRHVCSFSQFVINQLHFLRCEPFSRESRCCQMAENLFGSKSFHTADSIPPLTYSNILVNWSHLFL